ncbi:MAG: cytochrome c peroxidase [Pseudomonadota bacterium]
MRILFAAILACASVLANAAELPPPLTDADFIETPEAEVRLGHLLFWDPILSGNRNISCGSCHHPRFATGDGLSLGLGEGGVGLGPERRADPTNVPEQRIPRNSPALFNLGARSLTTLFHDGRIEADAARPSGFRTPLGAEMEAGFANLVSAQTMFPVLSADEMAGHYQENDVAKAVRQGRITGSGGAWDIISKRVEAIQEYRAMFDAAYPDKAGGPIHFTDISNAIAAFMAAEWRANQSPFDSFLRDGTALPAQAAKGLALFYGPAGCGDCHSGRLLSDQQFHAMGQPQLGPGKAARFESHKNDTGRMRVTGRVEDAYAFRTPMLRNVTRTGPWGHAGAFSDLERFLRHHVDPVAGLAAYEPDATLPPLEVDDWSVLQDATLVADITKAVSRTPVDLGDAEMTAILAFLDALTDETSLAGRLGVPAAVPSGLSVDR